MIRLQGEIIPIMGMITGTIMTGLFILGGVLVFRGPVGQAIARRIQGKAREPEQELLGEVHQMREHVAQLEQQVLEMEERLDFTERLLARHSEVPRGS